MFFVPTITQLSNNTERSYDIYSLLLKERIIMCTGEIEDNMSSSICAQLLYLDSISSDTIQMYINSCGGSISSGMAIYDTMMFIKSDVSTICMGMCASMAAVLLMAGQKEKRFALANSEIMIHQPLTKLQGTATDIDIHTKRLLYTKNNLINIICRHTNNNIEIISKDIERDYFLTAKLAVDYGIIDKVLEERLIR